MQLAELKRFAPAAKHTMLSGLMQAWPQAEAAGMVTPARICHFLAQCFVESRGFTDVEEDLSYSAKRLVQVWPKRFPTIESAAPYAHNPEALANKVYGGRMGNTDPGDGWKFRGRAIKQITGRANYKACGEAIGIDLEKDPDALFDPTIGARAAIWYWSQAGCNRFADQNDIRGLTKAINGGFNGLADRRAAFRKAVAIWGEDDVAETGRKTAATSNIGRASLAAGGLSLAGVGGQAYEVAQAVDSGRSIADAFGVSMFTLGLLIVIILLLIYIFRDRLFISKWEGF
ncbi:glycoside hydrolase family 19 protein [Ensifer adhaerens]|uniref:glycoside hydrolase family 19 protein n=1 Tax=Ensifer adhaerens TaxID=106592 RepID=UPI001CBB2FC9|nr:glycoside hydrolase family 19 protein [Ensifer adhaerens]MBZ7921672.1 glycoside hydrolase family 19 protein [Ensifer adhaerens]UAX94087.1 glycoside hydrolase family 19 protein [Ensifer adhaerens]UAY01721.1 glycoside hydrolase family 19 protein [Ensifer adhaerens]UAY09105.1 glycoside hydrolase family 19 protein [Ensifer adhaerens]